MVTTQRQRGHPPQHADTAFLNIHRHSRQQQKSHVTFPLQAVVTTGIIILILICVKHPCQHPGPTHTKTVLVQWLSC